MPGSVCPDRYARIGTPGSGRDSEVELRPVWRRRQASRHQVSEFLNRFTDQIHQQPGYPGHRFETAAAAHDLKPLTNAAIARLWPESCTSAND